MVSGYIFSYQSPNAFTGILINETSFFRTSPQPLRNRFFFRRFYFSATKTSNSLYGQLDDVRTRKICEIETAIDARERQKSNKVRDGRIELPPRVWKTLILPLN